ncbi:hypothetical protein FLONG3_9567 [Fusarium longipes]|uniref:Uncharacterized protein n=1 Tax=Fusarium longipes TaxID=694270 RepID=A0A395RW52_9HYPO|nr:hypothetical protein FLONG3_9567 [Fusarium longipes]
MDTTYSFRWATYCCFCLFEFHDGEKVIRPLHPSELYADGPPPSSRTVLFEYKTPVFDPQDERCVPPRIWRRYREVVPVTHPSCHQDWPQLYMKRLWNLVRYDFQPPLADASRRRCILAKQVGNPTKPALQEQARLGLKTLLSSKPSTQWEVEGRSGIICFVVTACQPIWATSMMFEGIRYITCLSNKQESQDFRQVSTDKNGLPDKISFASNHLGIIAIVFGDTVLSKQERLGVWWSCFRPNAKHCFLKAYTDGFKIRDLRLVESQYVDGIPPIRWSILPPEPKAASVVNLDDRAYSTPYFKLLDCGNPGITGYSTCMIDGDLVDLHCNYEGEDLSFYRKGGGDRLHAVWLYFPIQEGERIFEVWRQRKKPHFCRDIPILRTNKGRVFVLGTQTNKPGVSIEYDRLTSFPNAKHARFWFSYREGCVDYLAFDTEDRRQDKNEQNRLLQGPFALCSSGVANQFFATTASLEDVVQVAPCKSWAPGSTGIVGLVFTYSDGHREAVGQIRLDHLLSPIKVVPTGDMWLGVRELSYGCVIEKLRLIHSNGRTIYGGNTSEAGLRWCRVSWLGRLDWDFWHGRCFISHYAEPVSGEHVSKILEAQGGREWEVEMEMLDRPPTLPSRPSSLPT